MKRSKPRTLSIGTVSHGTMRSEDLIPAFISAAEDLRLSKTDRATIRRIEKAMPENRSCAADCASRFHSAAECTCGRIDYFDSEDASEDVSTLFDLLDRYCPDYCYFGATEGDGSDYGCWPSIESAEEDCRKVSDLSEVTKDDRQVLQVSDHGNVTLYRRAGNRWIEVWGIV